MLATAVVQTTVVNLWITMRFWYECEWLPTNSTQLRIRTVGVWFLGKRTSRRQLGAWGSYCLIGSSPTAVDFVGFWTSQNTSGNNYYLASSKSEHGTSNVRNTGHAHVAGIVTQLWGTVRLVSPNWNFVPNGLTPLTGIIFKDYLKSENDDDNI